MRFSQTKILALGAFVLVGILTFVFWSDLIPRGSERRGTDLVAADSRRVEAKSDSDAEAEVGTEVPDVPSNTIQTAGTQTAAITVEQRSIPGVRTTWQAIESQARSDSDANLQLSSLKALCQRWLREASDPSPEALRSQEPEWSLFASACEPEDVATWNRVLSEADPSIAPHLLPRPWMLPNSAEEFAERDRRLSETMSSSVHPALALQAAVVYLDFERFSQWAGPLMPRSMYDQRSYMESRIGMDVAWMYACRLGLDCGPYAGFTLDECWQTPGCVPGGAARQIVQMRRSPLELRLIDSMVERLLAMRRGRGG